MIVTQGYGQVLPLTVTTIECPIEVTVEALETEVTVE